MSDRALNIQLSAGAELYPQYLSALDSLPLPLAYLDINALKKNADEILRLTADKNIRIVSKSIRCLQALKFLLAYHPRFIGVMAYSLDEAVYLSECGIDDVLVAYPSSQKCALERVAQTVKAGGNITVMADCLDHLRAINDAARRHSVTLAVCIDIDMSTRFPGLYFGVHRSPVKSVDALTTLIEQAKHLADINVIGFMGYEAQIAGVADNIPGKQAQNLAVPWLKRVSQKQVLAKRKQAVNVFVKTNTPLQIVNGGGTGSMVFSANDSTLNEVAVGSGFFCPHLFDYYSGFTLSPAAGFALEVCRIPDDEHATCLGGGYVASGGVGFEKLPQPYLPEGLALDGNEGAGEVQTPLVGNIQSLKTGSAVFFRHAKAGELCERFNALAVIENGKVLEHWHTYRGEGKNFL